MAAEALLAALLRVQLVASAAIMLVLLLRPLVLRRFGPALAYGLWLVVPIAAGSSLLPAREQVLIQPTAQTSLLSGSMGSEPTAQDPVRSADEPVSAAPVASNWSLADTLIALWLVGAGALLLRSVLGARRLAADPDAGPALIGMLRPRLLLPRDFETRFESAERALILKHEATHRSSGHLWINALIELARCASWFNPLAHVAAMRLRADQELACDAAVLSHSPDQAHVYGQALLKAQIKGRHLALACSWPGSSARRLRERILLLDHAAPTRRMRTTGLAMLATLSVGLGYAAWAQQPDRIVTQQVTVPSPLWTAAADAPRGSLSTALEGDRHDRAIKLARQGNIDMVLFGTSNAEMFWWKYRGRAVWDRHFGRLRAANFGSQGTQRDSLIWRMQHGELSGFSAKLVIVQTWLGANAARSREDAVDTYAPVIAEIRKYQPQAKILLFADFPRGQLNHNAWREVARQNAAAFAPLIDDRNVFYVDIGERFYLPDGRHNQNMWRFPSLAGPANVGMQPAGFEAWAEELQPWIERFVL